MAGDLPAAIAAAHNLRALAPSASLPLLLLYLERDPARYPRAAARWLVSLVTAKPTLEIGGLAELASALELLGVDRARGRDQLAEAATRQGLDKLARALRD